MHIAICDDNIADRKQTERLMKRESDKIKGRGDTLYCESFGNAGSLLFTPMQYDLFIIDIRNTPGSDSFEVAKKLTDKGVGSPICIIYPREDGLPEIPEYIKENTRDRILFLAKPLRQDELSGMLLHVEEIRANAISKIELRGEFDTLYVSGSDILYAERDGLHAAVKLSSGATFVTSSDVSTLFDEIKEEHLSFVMPSINYMLNIDHITALHFHTAVMSDKKSFKIGGPILKYVKKHLDNA